MPEELVVPPHSIAPLYPALYQQTLHCIGTRSKPPSNLGEPRLLLDVEPDGWPTRGGSPGCGRPGARRPQHGPPLGRGGPPAVVTGPGDADDLAQPLDAMVALVVVDQLEAVHQRVSPAKYLAALRRMSRSSSSSRTRLRSVAFSSSGEAGAEAFAVGVPVRCASSSLIQLRSVSC